MRPDGVLTLCFDSGLLDAIERTSLFLRRPEWEIRVNGRSTHIRRRSARNVTGSSNNVTTTESELVTNADEARRSGREHTHCERCNSGEPRRAHPSKTTLGLFCLAELPKLRQFLPYLQLMQADNSPSLSHVKSYERVIGEFPTAGEAIS